MRLTIISTLLTALTLVGLTSAVADDAAPLQLVLELRDGTRLRGTAELAAVPLDTAYGKLNVPIKLIRTITFIEKSAKGETWQEAKVEMRNGDKLQGRVGRKSLELQTPYGKATVPVGQIVRIEVRLGGLAAGLVGFWKADGDAKDSLGGHHGSAGKGVCYTTDRHGNPQGAFCFNGQSGFVTVPDCDTLDTDQAFTLSAWVKATAYKDENGYGVWIVSKYYTGGPDGHADYALSINHQGNVEFVVARHIAEGFDVLAPRPVVPKNAWTHVAATFDRGVMKVYLNGRLVGTKVSQTVQCTDPAEYVHDDVIIGAHWDDTFNFTGAIDEVGIWNRALSDVEIAQIAGVGEAKDLAGETTACVD